MADDTTTETDTDETTTEEVDDTQTDESQDTTDWKAMARKHEREAKAARKEADRLRTANETAQEAALRAAREEASTEVRTELGPELTKARTELAILKSEAGKKLADPTDFLAFGDVASITKDDGSIDPKKLEAAIDRLLTQKPHLAAAPGAQRTPVVPTGARQGAPAGGDMNTRLRRAAGY